MPDDSDDPLAELARLVGVGGLNFPPAPAPAPPPVPAFLREARLRQETQALLRRMLGHDWPAELLLCYIGRDSVRRILPPR